MDLFDKNIRKKGEFHKLLQKGAKSLSPKEKKILEEKCKPFIGKPSGLSQKEFDKVLREAEHNKESGIKPGDAYRLRKYGK
ncbi:hypothetical protein HYT00_02265 [Candidatus Giovannonibacteria bacterium]|nr:hypothetical protein [Candidatus Giovannonibacteria bacterium]